MCYVLLGFKDTEERLSLVMSGVTAKVHALGIFEGLYSHG